MRILLLSFLIFFTVSVHAMGLDPITWHVRSIRYHVNALTHSDAPVDEKVISTLFLECCRYSKLYKTLGHVLDAHPHLITVEDKNHFTGLHFAVIGRAFGNARLLLDHLVKHGYPLETLTSKRNFIGSCPLDIAMRQVEYTHNSNQPYQWRCTKQMIKLLMQAQAPINSAPSPARYIATLPIMHMPRMISYFIARGALPETFEQARTLLSTTNRGRELLTKAIALYHLEIVCAVRPTHSYLMHVPAELLVEVKNYLKHGNWTVKPFAPYKTRSMYISDKKQNL